jgi:hypothetical protein
LGNFCFSNIYSDGRIKEIDKKKGAESIILNVVFSKNSYTVNMIPIRNKNLYLEFDKVVLERYKRRIFYFKIINKIKILWGIYYLKFRYIDPIIFYFWGNDHKFLNKLSEIKIKKIIRYFRR